MRRRPLHVTDVDFTIVRDPRRERVLPVRPAGLVDWMERNSWRGSKALRWLLGGVIALAAVGAAVFER